MEIYEDQFDLLDIYNTDDPNYMNLISARVVGRKIGHMLRNSEKLRERLLSILNRKTTGVHWPEIAIGIGTISLTV